MKSKIFENIKAILGALILAFLIRHFFVEPYKIPSGSMLPTLQVGDFLFVNKMSYNISLPFTNIYFKQESPKRGDIAVFKREDPNLGGSFFGFGPTYFIKRIVAVPGDKIKYINKRLVVNGQMAQLEPIEAYKYTANDGRTVVANEYTETLLNLSHQVLIQPYRPGFNVPEVTVPQGFYVMMGDNRDNSVDSRFWNRPGWAFVRQEDLMGRAEFIFWSWRNWVPRLDRLFNGLHAKKVAE